MTHRLLHRVPLRPSLFLRPLTSLCAAALLLGVAFPADAAGISGTVSRTDFLIAVTEALYGEIEDIYPVSLTNVPERARAAIGLAISADALPGWERAPAWDAPVSRGHAISVLFTLADILPPKPKNARFRDVAPGDAARAERAAAWGLLEPLTSTSFGWNRALRQDELDRMLRGIATRLTLPLAHPAPLSRTPDAARQRRQVTTPASAKSGRMPKKKTITVEFGIDSGSRGIPTQELPRQELLSAIWGLIQSRYLHIEDIKEEDIAYGLAEKLMGLLNDPYSTFFRPSSAKSFQEQLQGELTGIGAQVESHPNGGVIVVSPLAGSPALAAGVRPGDRITHVNGASLLELNLQDAVAKIRGPAGTTVELTIDRGGSKIAITVVRAKITLPEIEVTRQDNVLVLKLYQFGERTIRELDDILEAEIAKQPVGMVLDLRNNPGGLLDAATSVLGHFFAGGTTVANVKTRSGTRAEVTRGLAPVVPESLPLIVLVNKGSASASEIVAGALQDLGRAKIMGVKTYGKGSVQEVVQLNSGESVKLTTGAWFTPNGRSIQKEGITPDIVREERPGAERDALLLEAVQLVRPQGRR